MWTKCASRKLSAVPRGVEGAGRPRSGPCLRFLGGVAARSWTARRLAAVRGFSRSLREPPRLPTAPPRGVWTQKPRRKLPVHLTLDDVDRLLAVPRADGVLG